MRDRKSDAHTKNLPIKPGQVRHHINEDKSDNTPINLVVKSRSVHTSEHNRTRSLGKLRRALSMPARKERLY